MRSIWLHISHSPSGLYLPYWPCEWSLTITLSRFCHWCLLPCLAMYMIRSFLEKGSELQEVNIVRREGKAELEFPHCTPPCLPSSSIWSLFEKYHPRIVHDGVWHAHTNFEVVRGKGNLMQWCWSKEATSYLRVANIYLGVSRNLKIYLAHTSL